MFKKFLACMLLVMLTASGAWAALDIWTSHQSIASLTNGHADYSDARFMELWIGLGDGDTIATESDVNNPGTLTLSGGNYSYWDPAGMHTNTGAAKTFNLMPNMSAGENLDYWLENDYGEEFSAFMGSADNGLNGVTASWNFPDTSKNGSAVIPSFRTTAEQVNTFLPYFELVSDDTGVTGLKWRVIVSSDTGTAISRDSAMSFRVAGVYDEGRGTRYSSGEWVDIPAGTPASGEVSFGEALSYDDIWSVRLYLGTEGNCTYEWYFCKPSNPSTWLWQNHLNTASLTNGKSDYSTASFDSLYFDVRADEQIIVEEKHFTDAGRLTIPGGGYSLMDDDTGDELGVSVPSGQDRTYKLRMYNGVTLDDDYVEYQPINDSGINLAFSGGAETGLNGKTVSWTFPAELNFDGSTTVCNFKSTAEQLVQGVPYVEVVSADGYITGVIYRIVRASDTATAINPGYNTDFRLYINKKSGNSYRTRWLNNQSSGTWHLDVPQPVSDMSGIRARLRIHDPAADGAVYQWKFKVSSPIVITTTSLPNATANSSYSVTLQADTSGVTWAVASGDLPNGLTLNSSTGVISGTPTADGISIFMVRASRAGYVSAEKVYTLTVQKSATPTTIEITTTTLPDGIIGNSYSASLASNPSGATWAITSSLPAGLTLNAGTISGVPTTTGSFTFRVRATYGTATASKDLTIVIADLAITTSSLPSATVGDAYNQTLTANGSGLRWDVSAGNIPAGLSLNESSGVISGTLTTEGEYTFTVSAANSYATATKQFTVNVQANSGGSTPSNSSGSGCGSFFSVAGLAVLAFIMRKR
ncbi:MAG: putative Ig domain-containing protein [Synergistaceae bacterium]|nr:putative Ig domain-containing protein [Synergistaceae bacterium]